MSEIIRVDLSVVTNRVRKEVDYANMDLDVSIGDMEHLINNSFIAVEEEITNIRNEEKSYHNVLEKDNDRIALINNRSTVLLFHRFVFKPFVFLDIILSLFTIEKANSMTSVITLLFRTIIECFCSELSDNQAFIFSIMLRQSVSSRHIKIEDFSGLVERYILECDYDPLSENQIRNSIQGLLDLGAIDEIDGNYCVKEQCIIRRRDL